MGHGRLKGQTVTALPLHEEAAVYSWVELMVAFLVQALALGNLVAFLVQALALENSVAFLVVQALALENSVVLMRIPGEIVDILWVVDYCHPIVCLDHNSMNSPLSAYMFT
jgi:TRAP-type C4-dicarboxylate transport system permease large subunit